MQSYLLLMAYSLSLLASATSGSADINDNSTALEVRVQAERRVVISTTQGAAQLRYMPAEKVRDGEQIHFTLRVRNAGSEPIDDAVVVRALPHNTRYVAMSAAGPAADVSFSVDGGASFSRERELTVTTALGVKRGADPVDYTHIRWKLRHPLVPGAVALLRFRAEFF
ncbi:MAG: DUF11 domain-containing protein [Candidatus Obscuribacterales bacterium]|nr:DUF11 domain-containing protein [Steroidobacteraceae bacterium]